MMLTTHTSQRIWLAHHTPSDTPITRIADRSLVSRSVTTLKIWMVKVNMAAARRKVGAIWPTSDVADDGGCANSEVCGE